MDDRSLGNMFDSVVHFTMQIPPPSDLVLSSFINLEDAGSHIAERLFMFTDQHRGCCFNCGHTDNVGKFCHFSLKVVGAPSPSGVP
jgi:hypothetical protein